MNSVLTETLKTIKISDDLKAPVFRTPDGHRYRNFRTAFDNALRRAGIADFTFHDLRHTFASRLVMKEVDLTTVKELMGHKGIAMTLRYAHLAPGHKRNAVELLTESEEKVPSIFTTGGRRAKPSLAMNT